jgi:ankyrin repeat protein
MDLIRLGADPLLTCLIGRSVLYIIIEAGCLEVLILVLSLHPLIDLNAPITTELNHYCPLHVAARYNHGHLINILIEKGADMEIIESECRLTPLGLAVILKNEWVASVLIHRGANPGVSGVDNPSPLKIAAEKGITSIINLLNENSLIHINQPVSVDCSQTLLHVALNCKQSHVVALVVKLGADVNMLNMFGDTPLSTALINGNESICLLLLESGSKIDIPSVHTNRYPL